MTFSSASANSTTAAASFLGSNLTIRSLTYDSNVATSLRTRFTTTRTSNIANNLTFSAALGSASISIAAGATGAIEFTVGTSIGNLTANSDLLIDHNGSGNFSIAPNINGVGNLTVSGTGNTTITGSIATTGGAALSKDGSGTLRLSGNNSFSGDTTINAGTLQVTSTGRFGGGNYSGNIANSGAFIFGSNSSQTLSGIISGTGSLTKNGSGILSLSGNNSNTGSIIVQAGTMTLEHANALGIGGNISFTGGGVQYGTGVTTDLSSRIKNSTGAILIDTNGNNITFASVLDSTNTLGLTKNGSGTLSLSNDNAYSGATTINAGTLEITATGQLTGGNHSGNIVNKGNFLFGSDSNQILAGVISSTGSLTKNGTGTLTLSGNNTYNGTTSINAGTLEITSTGRLGAGTYAASISNNGSFIMGSNSAQTLSGIISGTGSLTKNGSAALTLSGNSTYSGDTIINTGTLQVSATGLLGGGSYGGNITNSASFLFASNSSQTLSGIISGTGSLTKNGTGTLSLSGNNTYTGITTLRNGTITLDHDNGLGSGGNITFTGGALQYGTGISTDISSRIKNSTSAILIDTNGNDVSFAGVLDSTNTLGLTKNGTGTLSLLESNIYTGATTINGGTITLGASDRIANTSNINVAGGTFNLAGYNETVGSLSGAGNIALGSGDLTTNSTSNSTFSGVLSGTGGALTKAGTGRLSLSGNNTYTGTTTLRSGTIILDHANALGTGGDITFTGGGLQYGAGISTDISSRIKNSTTAILIDTNGNNVSFAGELDSSNTLGLTKNGTGTLSLSGNNTYTGTTTINTGVFEITSTGLLGGGAYAGNLINKGAFLFGSDSDQILSGIMSSTGSLTKNGTGTLTLSGINTYNGTTSINAGTLEIASTGRLGAGTYAANITNNGSLIIGSNSAQTLSGIISGTGSLTKNGSAALTLSGNNTYSGDTIINTGTLQVSATGLLGGGSYAGNITNAATFLFASNSSQSLSGIISGTGSLTKNGTGTLSLSGNNSYSGATTINTGTFEITSTGLLGSGNYSGNITNKGNFLFGSDSDQILSGIMSSTGSLTKNGTGTLSLSGNNTYSGTTTIHAGTLEIAATGRLGAGSYTADITNNGSIIIRSSSNQTLSGIISGTGSLTKNGSGTLILSDINTYTGDTVIDAGTLQVSSTGLLGGGSYSGNITNSGVFLFGSNSSQTLSGMISGAGSLTKNGTGTLSLSNSNTYSGATTINTGTFEITATGQLGGGNYSGNITNKGNFLFGSDSDQILSGVISSTGSLTKNGTGTLSLSGNNTYNGTTTINDGTLEITATGRLNGGSYAANISNNGSFIIGSTNNQTLSGIISGTGSLTQNGSGVLTLSGNSTYSGATAINAGTLQVSSTGLLGGGSYSGDITNDGVFLFGSNSNQTLSGIISGTGSLTKNGTGKLSLSGSSSYSGTTTINTGTLEITSTGLLGGGNYSGDITNKGNFLYRSDSNQILSGVISGNGSLTTNGTGTLSLSGNNTYNGTTTITAGTLEIAATGRLNGGNYSGNISNSGSFIIGSTNNQTLAGIISGAGSLTKNGSGVLTLSGNSTYSGNTAINAGTLKLGTNGSISSSSAVSIANGAVFDTTSKSSFAIGTAGITIGVDISGAGFLTSNSITLGNGLTISMGTATPLGTYNLWDTTGTVSGNFVTVNLQGQFTGSLSRSNITWSGTFGGYNFTLNQNTGNFTSALAAAQLFWTADGSSLGGSGTWNATSTNWSASDTAVSGSTWSSDSTGVFKGTAGNVSVDNLTANAGLSFETTGYTISSGTITLGGASATVNTIQAASGVNATISAELAGSNGFTKTGTGTLILSGINTYSGNSIISSGTLQGTTSSLAGNFLNDSAMVFDQSTTGTFSGNISGTGSLTKSGNGDVTLSGNNSYSGSTTINAGTLTLGSGNGIGSSSAVTIAGGTLAVGNQSQTVGTLSMSSGGLSIVSGNLTLGAGSSITGGTLSFDSAPAGRVNTNGTLTLGNSTFIYNHSVASTQGIVLSGNISVNSSATADFTNSGAGSGRITLGAAARVFDIGTSANMNVGWIIASTSTAGTLTKNGTGVLTLSGNNTYTGTTRINAGTLEITGSGRLGGGTYAAAISNNGSFIIGSNNNQTLSGIISGTGSLTKNGSGVLTLSGNSTYSGDTVINTGTLQIATTGRLGAGNYSGNITNTGDFVFGSTSNQTLSGIISGTGSLTKNGTGMLTISGNNSYTGTTTVRNGTITLAHANALGSGGEITFTGGGLQYGSGITTDISSRIKNSTATILIDTNGNNVSFDSAVDSTNTLGLTKNGTGTLSLTHINNYSGATVINAGILTISGSGQLGSGTYSGNISNAGGFVYSSSANQTLGGILSGAGSLTKSGASTLTLTGVNTSTGDISINAGTVAIGGTGQLGSGTYSGNISNAGEFKYESSANQTLNGIMSGNGGLTMDGAGILTLAGSNNYSGNTTINTGTVVIGNVNGAGSGRIVQTDGTSLLKIDTTGTITNAMSVYNVLASQSATLSGAITVNNATWDIETGDTLTISGAISGNGGVTKNGGGTLTLNGTNTYNGSTIVNDGTLNAASANALGSNTAVRVNGGSLLVSADNALNNKSVTLNSTSPTEAGLAFSGNYSGRVNNLTLSKNSIIDLGDGSVSIMFDTYVMSNFTLDIYNWTGTTLSNGGNGTTDTDNIYFGPDLSDAALANIRFHSGALGGGDSFLGSGFELMPRTTFDGGLGYHIIPVPEPETWATGIVLLLLGSAVWPMKRRRMLESGRQAPATVFLCVLGGAMRVATFLRPPFRARRTSEHDERRG